jgi:predicted phosphate transport protein (TIGR00153 family)
LESDADDLKRSIRLNLPRSLFMPVSRTDLLELVQAQDKIPNRTKDVVGLTLSRHMQFPSELGPLIIELASKTVSASQLAFEALKELDELFHSGFSGSEIDLITGMLAELNDVEHETDVLQGKLRDAFFSIEKDLNPVDVMFFYRMIEWIGEIADNSQSVGNRLLYLIAK